MCRVKGTDNKGDEQLTLAYIFFKQILHEISHSRLEQEILPGKAASKYTTGCSWGCCLSPPKSQETQNLRDHVVKIKNCHFWWWWRLFSTTISYLSVLSTNNLSRPQTTFEQDFKFLPNTLKDQLSLQLINPKPPMQLQHAQAKIQRGNKK
jgi:hypothetical protein